MVGFFFSFFLGGGGGGGGGHIAKISPNMVNPTAIAENVEEELELADQESVYFDWMI